nr:pyrroline-5-carboxylate reductase [Acinetobacter nectaris]
MDIDVLLNHKIGFIGGGNIAQALIGGLVVNGFPREQICVAESSENVRKVLQEKDISIFKESTDMLYWVDVVILAVKPQELASVLEPLKNLFKDKLIISIVAGASLSTLAQLTNTYNIVRAMPNIPALVQTGAHGIFASADVSEVDRNLSAKILAVTGLCIWVKAESDLDAVTAISGSGPAYFFYMMESMIRAGKNMGLDEKTAAALTLQTALGAAQMAISSGFSPAELRKKVTSPNGATEAALQVFDRESISQSIQTALAAAQKCSQTLTQGLSESTKSSS